MLRDDLYGAEKSDDAFLTLREAARLLNIPYYKVQRAAKAKLFPTYSLFNRRKYVKLRDILRVMHKQD